MANTALQGGMIAAALAAALGAKAGEAENAGKTPADELPEPDLSAITGYTFGDSRIALTAVRKLVTNTLKSAEKEQQKLANELVNLLDGDTTPDAKLFICRELARIATDSNVRDIAKFMDDPATVDLARYALHPIPGDGVEKELTRKLRRADAELQIAIFNTFGARANPASEAVLRKYVDDKDPGVAAAAQAALARLA